MKVRETKMAEDLQAGDLVISYQVGTDSKQVGVTLTHPAKITPKAVTIFWGDSQQRRIAKPDGLDVVFTTSREASEDEERERNLEAARLRIADARQRGLNVDAKIAKVNDEFAAGVKKDGIAYAIQWRADGIVKAVTILERWAMVEEISTRLFRAQADLPYEQRTLSIDEALVKAVLIVVEETKRELLRGYSNRSTNPYANAIEDDKRRGLADWLNDFDVTGVLWAAKVLGVTYDEKEEF